MEIDFKNSSALTEHIRKDRPSKGNGDKKEKEARAFIRN